VRTRRDRILLSDAVVAALLSAGATMEMVEAGKFAAFKEYREYLARASARRNVKRAEAKAKTAVIAKASAVTAKASAVIAVGAPPITPPAFSRPPMATSITG
jgi:hypothetical protein